MIFLIFLIFFTVNGAKSSPNGDCSIDGVTDEQWQTLYTNDPVDDNTINPFKVFNTENINSVSARGDDFQIYFDVKLEGNVITIAPTAEFKNYEIQETHDAQPTINIILDCICNTGRDSLSFMQPIKDLNTYNASFTQASYSFKLPMPLPADISLQCLTSTKIEACDDDISNIKLLFSINPPEDFTVISGGSIDASGRCYTVLIESAKPLTLTETTTYELMVTDTGNPASSSSVPLVIEINEQTAVPTNPQFISAYYTAVYDNTNEKHSITVNGAITLDKNDPSLSVTSIGEFKDNFDIVNNEGTITVTLKVNLPETTINEEVIAFLTLEANILNAQGPGRTVLAIYMPKKECPTTEAPTTPPSVIFLEDEYKFDVISGYNGKIGTVKAVAIPTENIEYSIVNDGENLVPNQLKIDKNSGVLTLSGNIDVGVYRVKAQASGISSGVKATANVEINIYIKTDTSEVLIVNTIEENTTSSLLLPCPGTETTCSYDIISQYPETDQPIFVYQDGKLNSEGISLQMDQIKDMMNPQFLLNLRLTNTKTTENSTKDDGTWNWLYLPETIPRDPSTLLVSVIIRDVNDHPPIFSVGEKLTVGYPAKALQNVLTPPYLVQVQATDLDKGMNGVIRYTSNDINFVVLPKTGVVYPGDDAFNDDSNKQFSIVASDMDGAVDAQTSTLNIEVKLLRQENLVFLTIQNKVLEDLVEVLEDLSDKTKLRINYLTAAVVSKDESDSSNEYLRSLQSTKANENYAIKLVIYALNSNNEVVTSDVLEKTLEETEDVEDISTDNWTPEVGAGVEETSTTGYIAAIAVLAVLLVIFMITGGVVYYLKIYKRRSNSKPYDSMTEDSGSIKFEKPQTDEVDDMSKRRPTGYVFNPPPIDEDEDNDSTDKKYESIPNKGWPVDSEIYNDPEDIKRSNEPSYDYDHKLDVIESAVDSKDPNEPRERTDSLDDNNTARKSVSFKQIVEKINIVVDNDKQDDEDVNVCL